MKQKPNDNRFALMLSLAISLSFNFIFLLLYIYGRENFAPPDRPDIRPLLSLPHVLFNIVSNFLLAYALYTWNFGLAKVRMKSSRMRLLVIILSTFALSLILSYALSIVNAELFEDAFRQKPHFIRGGMVRDAFIAVIVLFSTQLLLMWRKQQQTHLEYQKLLAENMQTRYQALKNQVDPHFLFNSLNTLNSLIKTDPIKAEEYVLQLSYVFRYILQQKTIITVEEEIEFTKAYCHLMKIRYGDSLSFNFEVEPKFDTYTIVPLCLQILVENAIKHNVISNKQPLLVTVRSNEDESITVFNPVQLKKASATGSRIGLANLSDRYRLISRREILIQKDEETFSVQVPIFKPANL